MDLTVYLMAYFLSFALMQYQINQGDCLGLHFHNADAFSQSTWVSFNCCSPYPHAQCQNSV